MEAKGLRFVNWKKRYKALEKKYNKLLGVIEDNPPLLRIDSYENSSGDGVIMLVQSRGKLVMKVDYIEYIKHDDEEPLVILGKDGAYYRGDVKFIADMVE